VFVACSPNVNISFIKGKINAGVDICGFSIHYRSRAYIIGVVIPFTGVGMITVISKSMAMSISTRIAKYVDRVSGVLIILAGIYILIDTFLW